MASHSLTIMTHSEINILNSQKEISDAVISLEA